MKKILSILLVAMMIVTLAGCGSKNSENNEKPGDKDSTNTDKKITLKVMDWSDSSKAQKEAFFEEYKKNNPNINIEYTCLTMDQYKNTILSAINSGDAPDLFPLPGGMDLGSVVKEGWFQPLEGLVSDNFKDTFVDGVFKEGVNVIDGKVYSIPEVLQLPNSIIFYNKDLFKKAGLNPEQPPKTFSELREYAKKITEAGNGEFYGIIEGGQQVNRWKTAAHDFSALGGSGMSEFSPVSLLTGESSYADKAMVETFELFKGMAEDGSYHPSTMSIRAPEARALFGAGEAGFIIQGVWCIGVWNANNPDLDLGIASQVISDNGRQGSVAMATANAWMGISATSEHPEEAAKLLEALYSKDYNYQKDCVSDGVFFSLVKGVNDEYLTNPLLKDYYEAATSTATVAPNPKTENPATSQFFLQYNDVSPAVGDLLQGTVAGAISDIEGSLKVLAEKVNKEFDRALKAANEKGANITKDDFKFDWDPMTNY